MFTWANMGSRLPHRVGARFCFALLLIVIYGIYQHTGSADGSAKLVSHLSDWPELHANSKLGGYASNGGITTSNAAKIGVTWSTNLYSASLGSPVVAFDPTLDETLAYIGNDRGDLFAVNEADGAIVWSTALGSALRASPVVRDGAVWIATSTAPFAIYKLDASTGAVDCTRAESSVLYSSPVAVTPPGGTASVYFATLGKTGLGGVLSLSAATCALQWEFNGYSQPGGTWDPLAYTVDATGEPLVLFGSADPDASAYAVDAVTGQKVWRFATNEVGDVDIGSGLTVSAPGINGFADGVAYVPSKDGIVYALDLTTGAEIWTFSLGTTDGDPNESLSTAALDGTNLVLGYATGVYDINAVTGKEIWDYVTPKFEQIDPPGPGEIISSPAISGPSGHEVVAFGDVDGYLRVLKLATGTGIFSYRTGSWITASPAITGSNLLVSSSDGYLYNFAPNGGDETTRPATAVTMPADGSSVANPDGDLTVSGTSSDGGGVESVTVAVRQGGSDGQWWDGATSSWSATPVSDQAVLSSPGSPTSSWSLSFPVPGSGDAYQVDAYTDSVAGQAAQPDAEVNFFVRPAAGSPTVALSAGFARPGGSLSVSGSGFGSGEQVSASLLGVSIATATTSSTGTFTGMVAAIPTSAGFGQTDLVVTGATSQATSAAAVFVTNSWPQLSNGPGHEAYEPHDPVDANTVDPAQNILLYPAWRFAATKPLTSPAVVDEVAYFGDGSGTLHAVDVHTGSQVWSWHDTSGKAVTGSPAVDQSAGLVFFGSADGSLIAISTAGAHRGTEVWSVSLKGGRVLSPVFDGTDVFAASTNGKVYALAEADGATVWSGSLASGASAPPALDSANGVLVVPEANDTVAAFASTRGTPLWQFATGGLVSATPIASGGNVYLGSADDDEYAISESSGTMTWSFATGGAIQSSAVLGPPDQSGTPTLFVGSADTNVYALDANTGAEQYDYPFGVNILGLTLAANTLLGVGSDGTVFGGRTGSKTLGADIVWTYSTGDRFDTPGAVVDGTFYASGTDGVLWTFTPYGTPPA